jgi:hypothetical protein
MLLEFLANMQRSIRSARIRLSFYSRVQLVLVTRGASRNSNEDNGPG